MLAGAADAVGLGVTSESRWSPANWNPREDSQGFPGEEGDRGSSQQERGGESKAQEGHKWYLEAARIRLDKQVGLVNERGQQEPHPYPQAQQMVSAAPLEVLWL